MAECEGDALLWGELVLWDVINHEMLYKLDALDKRNEGDLFGINSVAFSPDGKLLAAAGAGAAFNERGTLFLVNLANREAVAERLAVEQGTIASVAFCPGGKLLATGSGDGTVVLWDVESRYPLGDPLVGHEGPITCVTFSPDGKLLATGSGDKRINLWDVDLISWQHRACAIANRNLNEAEWRQFFGAQPYQKLWSEAPDVPDITGLDSACFSFFPE